MNPLALVTGGFCARSPGFSIGVGGLLDFISSAPGPEPVADGALILAVRLDAGGALAVELEAGPEHSVRLDVGADLAVILNRSEP